jgi:tetratricopeptide (TPR) repeat protein
MLCGPVSYSLEEESLFSENTAALFIKHASEFHQRDPLNYMQTEQAMAFLAAASSLDISPRQIPEQMLTIGAERSYEGQDYSGALLWALEKYLDERSDLKVATNALKGVLDNLNSRVEREALLEKLLRKYASVNTAFASELATQLGLFAVEKADMQTAINNLAYAHQLNPYNQLAFGKFLELSEAQVEEGERVQPILQTRRLVEMDPYDLDIILQYADILRQLQMYELASTAYEYASKVHQFLYPGQLLPEDILHGWLFSCYHGNRLQTKCLGITETYRDAEHFDLMLEAIAGKTLIKLGRIDSAKRLLNDAAQKAEEFALSNHSSQTVLPEYLAWYYSFILEQPEKSLAWSNQAFTDDPNRPGVEGVFSYCLALNGQSDLARQYAEPLKETDQIAVMALAMVKLSEGDTQAGLDSLRTVVEMSAGSFVAEKAIQVLEEQGSDYIPSAALETARERLESEYASRMVPAFMPPSDRCSVKLLFNGSDFLYGADFPARLVIENTSDEYLVISNEGMLRGNLRIDAVLEGSLNVQIPELLSMQFQPSRPIAPGNHLSIPLDLNRGRLKRLLMTYPQADVQVHFKAYLDPTISGTNKIENRLKGLEPVLAQIHRKGILLSRDFLLQRLDVLSKGQPGQKYRAASLFTGLLAEQKAVDLSGADFDYVRIEQVLLTDSVRKMLTDKDWKIRVHTLSSLLSLSVPLDGIVAEISQNLNHEKWPVRLMAMVLLAKAQPETFQKVLDWAAENDSYALNRRMAIALGGRIPEPVVNEAPLEVTE